MSRQEFLRLLADDGMEVRSEVPSGFRWLPHGVVVIARRTSTPV
jgi:hypothetical protein